MLWYGDNSGAFALVLSPWEFFGCETSYTFGTTRNSLFRSYRNLVAAWMAPLELALEVGASIQNFESPSVGCGLRIAIQARLLSMYWTMAISPRPRWLCSDRCPEDVADTNSLIQRRLGGEETSQVVQHEHLEYCASTDRFRDVAYILYCIARAARD